MAISGEHRAGDVPGQAHDRLLGNLWPLSQAGNERVAEIMPAVAYSGSGAGISPGFLSFSNRFVETKPLKVTGESTTGTNVGSLEGFLSVLRSFGVLRRRVTLSSRSHVVVFRFRIAR